MTMVKHPEDDARQVPTRAGAAAVPQPSGLWQTTSTLWPSGPMTNAP